MSTILSWVIKILFSCAAAVMLCYKVDWVQFSLSCERLQMMDLFFVFLLYNLRYSNPSLAFFEIEKSSPVP